ncbi:MAG: YqhA family protein [Burkholderiaceae bacterium]|nr:YqhA family protein [Burkholderiaceae bacterium]
MNKQGSKEDVDKRGPPDGPGPRLALLGRLIGRLRLVVLIPVLAVLLAALSLFVLGAVQAITAVWYAWAGVFTGAVDSPQLSILFLKTVSVILEAVVFFLIGVGLFSLFIAPLNLAIALGVDTLNDLEDRVIRIVVVILAVTFLERFIQWQEPVQTLQFGGALAVTVVALMLFQFFSRRVKQEMPPAETDIQERSKQQMFEHDRERHKVLPTTSTDARQSAE